jgi:hypothetical protein
VITKLEALKTFAVGTFYTVLFVSGVVGAIVLRWFLDS